MDLKIQESESALIVGTFGRAIWILDDLATLRTVTGDRLKKDLTALPMNDAVQVKGLFINPPGNIWTGFHTTFEGENKVFQKVKVPFYLKNPAKAATKVKATIFDEQGQLINTVKAEPTAKGLNYLIWKLDEQASNLPGAWINEESRGIPVLPGRYKIVIHYEGFKDSNYVQVLPDPRLELAPEVDEQLYAYQKEVDLQVEVLSSLLKSIDQKVAALSKLEKQLHELSYESKDSIFIAISKIKEKVENLRATGQTPRPKRQVGAWQTSKVTPYSKVADAQRIAMSRTRSISSQERELLDEATQLTQAFQKRAHLFLENDWQPFVKLLRQTDINWLSILE